MNTRGQQLLIDVWVDEEIIESNLQLLFKYVREVFTVVKEIEWNFHPQGLTKVFILSESHFALHTYPEHRYFSIDLYICNPNLDLEHFKLELLRPFKLKHVQSLVLSRGHLKAANFSLPTPEDESVSDQVQ